jgi:hypothetical protein
MTRSLKKWISGWLRGRPHFIIGDNYLLRWYVLPRNPWLNVYLHKFLHDDEDRALHDHPWWFISIMLKGAYGEVIPPPKGFEFRRAPSWAFRSAIHQHRVVLQRDDDGKPKPCWTLVITGRVVRNWGFWCPKGFVRWQDFTQADDYGKTGRGCE